MASISRLHVNGKQVEIDADSKRSLLSVLRDDLGLTGAKYGCGEGQCGACTVLVEGRARRACITPVGRVATLEIATIESLASGGSLHPLQEAFLEVDSFQCGYCTPGMILSALSLLRRNPRPSRGEIVQAMEGNVCRCGLYNRIAAAIEEAARKMRGEER